MTRLDYWEVEVDFDSNKHTHNEVGKLLISRKMEARFSIVADSFLGRNIMGCLSMELALSFAKGWSSPDVKKLLSTARPPVKHHIPLFLSSVIWMPLSYIAVF